MRLLFLTPQLPYPPRQGATLRNYHLIHALAQDHTVDLITLLAPGETLAVDSPLHRLCRRVVGIAQPARSPLRRIWQTFTSPLPDMAHRLDTPALHTCLRAWLRDTQYDIIQFEGIEMAPYLATARATFSPHQAQPALVFDNHNCEYLLQKRNALNDLRSPRRFLAGLYSAVQWWKLRRYEQWACHTATATVAVSQPDAQALAALAGDTVTIRVVPNGMTVPLSSPKEVQSRPTPKPDDPLRLVFTGKMDYRPNVDAVLWFARQVLPRILAQRPHIEFQIVGMNPHPRVLALANPPTIQVTGAVEDIQPYIQNAAVFVIPLRVGGGTRFKVLEALLAARPVVSTTLGVEGIGVEHERHLLLADRPDTFAQSVIRLLDDWTENNGVFGQELGHAARAFVARHYAWDKIVPTLESLYHDLISQKQSRSNGGPRGGNS